MMKRFWKILDGFVVLLGIVATGSIFFLTAADNNEAGHQMNLIETARASDLKKAAAGTDRAEAFQDYVRPEWFINELNFDQVEDWGEPIRRATHYASSKEGLTVKFACGKTYKVTKPVNLDLGAGGFVGSVEWRGCATDYEFQSGKPTIDYQAGGDRAAFSMRSAYGFRLERMKVQYTNPSFRGYLFDFSHSEPARGGTGGDSAYITVANSTLMGTSAASQSAGLLYFGNGIISRVVTNHFFFARVGVKGMAAGNSVYAYVFRVADNTFNVVDTAILNPSSNWTIEGNTFEPNRDGQLVAIDNDCASACTQASGITFANNYIADGSAQQKPIVRFKRADGLNITGNWWYSDTEKSRAAITLDQCEGVVVSGNSARPFETFIELKGGTTFGLTTIANKINADRIIDESGATCAGCNFLEPSRAGTAPSLNKMASFVTGDYASPSGTVFDLTFGMKPNAQEFKSGGLYVMTDYAYGTTHASLGLFAPGNGDAEINFFTGNRRRAWLSGAGFVSTVPVKLPDAPYSAAIWDNSADAPTKNAVRDEIERLKTAIDDLKKELQSSQK